MSLLLADATDLSQWANRRDAQSLLPDLLRRLVLTTGNGLDHVAFRSGDGVHLGGWDGTVRAASPSPFVASGYSGWEAGCDRDVKGKADDDYDARTRDPLGLDPSQTSFVFVTPRRWRDKAKWAADKKRTGVWKEIAAYDGDDLAAWLITAPAVHIWLSIAIGKHPRSAEDLESFCRTWARVTRPPLVDALLLAGRAEESQKVEKWALGQPSALPIQADTEDEALAFVLAALREMKELERDTMLARAVVVHDEPTWIQLTTGKTPLVLAPTFQDRSRIAAATMDGHYVVIPLTRSEPTSRDTVELPRPRCATAAAALEKMGIAKQEAEALAPLARAGLGALRRRLAITPAGLTPVWATSETQRDVVPALLVGRWDERREGDRAVVAELARRDYDEYRTVLERLSRTPDPPVRLLGTTWMISAKDDAWALLHRVVSGRDLDTFEAVAVRCLGEVNPKFDLAPKEQWLAALQGKVPVHSETIRDGIGDTVALLAATSGIFQPSTTRTGQEWADRIGHRILEPATTVQHWASLGPQLRALAEAAPDGFLDIAGRAFRPGSELATGIFSDADGIFSTSPHTELLWALELLAWSADHLARAALCLAGLASVDPGGKTVNRPLRSLHEIFLPWHPATAATVERRVHVLDLVRKDYPKVAWDLLCGLLPSGYGIAMPTPRPKRRDWAPGQQSVLGAEYSAIVQAVTTRVRDDVGTDGPRWKTVLESLSHLQDADFEPTIDRLAAIDPAKIRAADRLEIWSSLRSIISRHREFGDASWALPASRLERLDQLYERLQPVDPLERVAWLFNNGPQPPACIERDWRKRATIVEEMRREAVQTLAAQEFAPLLELAEKVEHPRSIGFALGQLRSDITEAVLARTLGSPNLVWRDVAQGLLFGRASVDGQRWLEELRESPQWEQWSTAQKTDYFLALPFGANTWELLADESPAILESYWQQVGYMGRGQLSADDRDQAAAAFVSHRRFATATHFLSLYSSGCERPPNPQFALELLERIGTSESTERDVNWSSLAHDIGGLLEIAAAPQDAPIERIAKLEWLFLRLLEHQRPPKALHAAMSRDPSLFVEVLTVVYKGRNEPASEVGENDQLLASLGHDLLEEWRLLPGSGDSGAIDPAQLSSWMAQARDLATSADRAAIADIQIGGLLACAPPDKDGHWPHISVRDLIEQIGSEPLERGIVTGIYNNRGLVSRAADEGGEQERELVRKYRGYVIALSDRWPRTARMLKAIAERYNKEARDEDLRAEFEDDRWS